MSPSDPASGTGDRPQDEGAAGPRVVVDRAAHLTTAFDLMVRRCGEAVSSDRGLHHVAHYSAGVYDFAVDLVGSSPPGDDVPSADDPPPGDDPVPADDPSSAGDARPGAEEAPARSGLPGAGLDRRRCVDTGRRLSFKVTSLDHALEEVRTGQLIRAVIHTETGVAYCNSVTQTGCVVALTAGATDPESTPLSRIPAVREADRASGDLATTLRRDLSLGSFDPGGWRHERPVTWLTPPPEGQDAPGPPPEPEDAVAPFQHGTGDPETVARCAAALDPEELVYLAHYSGDAADFSLDFFDHRAAGRFFTHISVAARRAFYAQFGRQFAVLGRQLAQLVRPLFEGRLLRVVLDVEQGAFYYYRLGSGRYLVGVTMSQHLVSQGDDRMAELALELRTRRAVK
jgi:hypothetical protein